MSSGLRGLRDAIILVLSTSFTFGAVVALILNLIIPQDSSTVTTTDSGSDKSQEYDPAMPVKVGLAVCGCTLHGSRTGRGSRGLVVVECGTTLH
jgi:hypothetical protein